MAKQIKLSVPVPCHENWENMSPVEKGRFCGSCQKQVVDFSQMSDRVIAEFFKKPSTGSVCGRFMNDQLNRDIAIPKKRIPWLKYFFHVLIPAFLLSQKSSAQGKVIVKTEQAGKDVCMPTMGIIAIPVEKEVEKEKAVNGRVVDEDGNPIPSASVIIKGTRKGTSTGYDGSFKLVITNNFQPVVITVSAIGFESLEYKIEKTGAKDTTTLVLKMAWQTMGEVVTVCNADYTKGQITLGAIVRVDPDTTEMVETNIPIIDVQVPPGDNSALRVFPNPVQAGSKARIAFDKSAPGQYRVQFTDMSGKTVQESEFIMESGATLQELNIPLVVPGIYIMAIMNVKSRKTFSQKVIIR